MKQTVQIVFACLLLLTSLSLAAAATDDGIPVDKSHYADRPLLSDFTEGPCSNTPRTLQQVNGNLYRHTAGAGLAVHSGLVLITQEGALVIDPAMTCTAIWLRDEIRRRFNVSVG